MTEISKQAQPAAKAKPEQPKKTEAVLEDKQLDAVSGGQTCAAGEHYKKVKLTT